MKVQQVLWNKKLEGLRSRNSAKCVIVGSVCILCHHSRSCAEKPSLGTYRKSEATLNQSLCYRWVVPHRLSNERSSSSIFLQRQVAVVLNILCGVIPMIECGLREGFHKGGRIECIWCHTYYTRTHTRTHTRTNALTQTHLSSAGIPIHTIIPPRTQSISLRPGC
jgi:hypothetical protein